MITIKVQQESITLSEKEFKAVNTLLGIVENLGNLENDYTHILRSRGGEEVRLDFVEGDYFLEVK